MRVRRVAWDRIEVWRGADVRVEAMYMLFLVVLWRISLGREIHFERRFGRRDMVCMFPVPVKATGVSVCLWRACQSEGRISDGIFFSSRRFRLPVRSDCIYRG